MASRDDRTVESAEFGDTRRRPDRPPEPDPAGVDGEWWSLPQAEAATGVPVRALRRWHRRGTVTSRLIDTPAGSRIQVLARDVRARAAARDQLRTHPPDPAPPQPPVETPAAPSRPPSIAPAPQPGKTPPPSEHSEAVLIPVEAWQRMLAQLGNLHEAGQQLAAARERAARAETEAQFLRERLREVRAPAPGSSSRPLSPAPYEEAPEPTAGSRPTTGDVPRTTPGRALDGLIDSARRAWARRRAR